MEIKQVHKTLRDLNFLSTQDDIDVFPCPSSLNTNINHENSTRDNQRKTPKSGKRAVNQFGIPRLQKPKSSRVFYIPTLNRRPRLALQHHNVATEGRPQSHSSPKQTGVPLE